ncbi:unnamed protein product [Didymodactylos carnosus]|uniref:Copper acquisition factor BIM1-like domain-containing protein n=1 Tax=Didymodactylos carnosus TaxID=1234261 RepID=A0A814UBD3_9BILA|nr:unnamed protein product [Didymodactylos carnosus]CAF1172133.1 unnamed protein product [Didymodactylos carnosus]CAF3727766.1 unnamed protein product [Didymodactylos carnosus]CAF3936029.1 unnamed protein product [Didymodactylos carnosus]
MQRGNFSISIPGDHTCYRKLAPCGDVDTIDKRTKLTAGKAYTIEFQQNLNHYYTQNPGKLDVSFALGEHPSESDFEVLASVNDYNAMNQITQTNFSLDVMLPDVTCEKCVIRVRYLSNNLDEDDRGTIFYQCSDVELTKEVVNEQIIEQAKKRIQQTKMRKEKQNDPHDCCAPPSFSTVFLHNIMFIPKTDHRSSGVIFYDQPSKMMRVFLMAGSGKGNTTEDGRFNMWMNFTSGRQYYHNINAGTCDLYGLDFWNDWCFGNTFNQSEDFVAANVSCATDVSGFTCNHWQNGDFRFDSYVKPSSEHGCWPAGISRSSNEKVAYFGFVEGPFPPSTWIPDPICTKQKKLKHAHNPLAFLKLNKL